VEAERTRVPAQIDLGEGEGSADLKEVEGGAGTRKGKREEARSCSREYSESPGSMQGKLYIPNLSTAFVMDGGRFV